MWKRPYRLSLTFVPKESDLPLFYKEEFLNLFLKPGSLYIMLLLKDKLMRYFTFIILLCQTLQLSAQVNNSYIRYNISLTNMSAILDDEFGEEEYSMFYTITAGGTSQGPYCYAFDGTNSGSTNANNYTFGLYYNRSYFETFTVRLQAWEDDDDPRCSANGGDDAYYDGLFTSSNPPAYVGPSTQFSFGSSNSAWVGNNLIPNTSIWDFLLGGIWRYENGENFDEALQFDNVTIGGTSIHNNSTKTPFPLGTSNFQYDDNMGTSAADVYYTFVLDEPYETIIRTNYDGTDPEFDTYLYLYDENQVLITENDDFGGSRQSQITEDLCPGRYYIRVTGYSDNQGDFKLGVRTNSIGSPSATVTATDASCGGNNDGSITITSPEGVGNVHYALNSLNTIVSSPVTNLAPGTYNVHILDDCDQVTSYNVTIGNTDVTAPVAICLIGETLNLPDEDGGYTFTADNLTVLASLSTDNCGITQTSVSPSTIFPFDGEVIPYELTVTDAAGNSNSCSAVLNVNLFTSVDQNAELDAALQTFPNPTSGQININLTNLAIAEGQLFLRDQTGRTVKQVSLNNTSANWSTTLDLNQLPGGVYTLQLITSEGQLTRRIVKQ